eukprot:GHRR01032908.1.p1 GENE.GHRR01032908.1~~GHRR01032908.1.p1  ORF type:complete len:237 (+),score=75.19 GHRR01032908.1:354-1064(+)
MWIFCICAFFHCRCGMLFMSDAAVNDVAVMLRWLKQGLAADPTGKAATWFSQLFPKAYDLAMSYPAVVPSTRFGLLDNVLSQLAVTGMDNKRDLAVALARGLGYTLKPEQRQEFVAQIVRLVGNEAGGQELCAVPVSEDPLALLLDHANGNEGFGLMNHTALDHFDHRLMLTDDVRSLVAVLAPWLAGQQPFLLVSVIAAVAWVLDRRQLQSSVAFVSLHQMCCVFSTAACLGMLV